MTRKPCNQWRKTITNIRSRSELKTVFVISLFTSLSLSLIGGSGITDYRREEEKQ